MICGFIDFLSWRMYYAI